MGRERMSRPYEEVNENMTWLEQQLKRGEGGPTCSCGKHNKNGKGLYCFLHNKQTPDVTEKFEKR